MKLRTHIYLRLQEVHITDQRPAAHQLHLRGCRAVRQHEPRNMLANGRGGSHARQPTSSTARAGPMHDTARHGTARHGTAWHGTAWHGAALQTLTRCAVNDCFFEFQKASTKILLYLIAMGHTVAPAALQEGRNQQIQPRFVSSKLH